MPGTSDTFTTSNRLDKQPVGGNYNLWGLYLNTNFDLIDALKDGNVIITMSTTQHTLTTNNAATDEARMGSITVIGTPGGTATMTAPNVQKLTQVENIMTGGYPLVWTNGTGTSVTIYNGAAVNVQCDSASNMKILGGSQLAGRILRNMGAGTATDDGVRVDQVATLSRGVPLGGDSTSAKYLVNLGYGTATGTATALTSSTWLSAGSAGLLSQGYETLYVPAAAFIPLSTSGGTSTTIQCTTSSKMVKAVVFGSASAEYASFDVQMPKSWDGLSVLASFNAFTTGTTANTFEMNVGLAQTYDNVTIDRAFNYSTAAIGTEHSTASFMSVTGTATASVTGGTASINSILSLMVRRNTTSTNQTMAGNVFLTGVTIRYNNNLPNDG